MEAHSHAGRLHVLEYPHYQALHGAKIALSRSGTCPLRTSTLQPQPIALDPSPDYILLPFAVGLAAVGLATVRFGQQLSELTRGLVYSFITDRLANDTNALIFRLLALLDVLTVISAGLLTINLSHALSTTTSNHIAELLLFSTGMGLFGAYRAYSWTLHKAVELITQGSRLIAHLRFSGLLPLRLAPIALIPLSFAAHYGHPNIVPYIYYTIILIITICIMLRWRHMAALFLRNGVPFLYFILYLCALEIAPALIVAKLLTSYLNI